MKSIETDYDNHGWKLKVKKTDDGITQIYLRSVSGAHKSHKPFYLRLTEKNLKDMLSMIKQIDSPSVHKESLK